MRNAHRAITRAQFPTLGGEACSPRHPLEPYRPRPRVWAEDRADSVPEVEKFR